MKGEYVVWERRAKLNLLYYFILRFAKHHKRYFGYYWPNLYGFFSKGTVRFVWNRKEDQEVGKKIISRFLNDKFYHQKKVEYNKVTKKFDEVMNRCNNLQKLSDKRLLALYHKFANTYGDWWGFTMVAESLSHGSEKIGHEILGEGFDKYFYALIMPEVPSFSAQEEISSLNLLEIIDRNQKLKGLFKKNTGRILGGIGKFRSFRKKVRAHAIKHAYKKNDYVTAIALDEGYFISEIKKMASEGVNPSERKKALDRKKKRIREDKINAIRKLNLSSKDRKLFKLMEWFVTFQDERKAINQKGNYYAEEFCREFSRRSGYPLYVVENCIPNEFRGILSKSLDLKLVRERYDYCVTVSDRSNTSIVMGSKAKKLEKQIFGSDDRSDTLKGLCACRGHVRGMARIILNPMNVEIKKGDILVTTMTTPDYIHLMKKAGAIVTDEGGVTCHAAIVSREFGIPCIIGTKNATKVFKDGDVIDVDANKGIVRKAE